MKKFIYIAFIVALLNSAIIPAEDIISSGSFDLVLTRPGVTDYYFTSYGSDNRLSEEVTFSLVSGTPPKATAELGFTCHMYDVGTFNVDLIFASSTENYGNTDTDTSDFMLRYKDDGRIGLNYSVSVSERDEASASARTLGSLEFVDDPYGTNSTISSLAVESSRTLRLINGGKVTASSGISRSFDIKLTLNAPTREDDKGDAVTGFSAGQYEGEIVVNVTTAS